MVISVTSGPPRAASILLLLLSTVSPGRSGALAAQDKETVGAEAGRPDGRPGQPGRHAARHPSPPCPG